MPDREQAERAAILARIAASREELRSLFDPQRRRQPGADAAAGSQSIGAFPRSRTMQMLLSGRGIGTVGAVAAGLLIARPALGLRLLRMVPASAVLKMVVSRAATALRTKQRGNGSTGAGQPK
jgi:hypothetical protein